MGVEPDGRYTRIILLIVESGAIISATKLTEFTLFNIAPDSGIGGLKKATIVHSRYAGHRDPVFFNMDLPRLLIHCARCTAVVPEGTLSASLIR